MGGELEVLGYAIPRQARRMHARMGLVPQADNLDPDFSVAHNLRTYARYFGIPKAVLAQRLEQVGETLFCYADDEQPVLTSLRQHGQLQFIRRRANLEDVFLKLTGKELRDA